MSAREITVTITKDEQLEIMVALQDAIKLLGKFAEKHDEDGYWRERLNRSIAALKKVEAA